MRILGLALVAVVATLVAPNVGSAASTPAPACNGGGCGGWFRSNVTVTLVIRSSRSHVGAGLRSDDGHGRHRRRDAVTCTVYAGDGVLREQRHRREGLEPAVGRTRPSPGRPDSNGWYTSPVGVSFSGDGGPSGISSCTSGTYSGPDSGDAKVTGSCTDGAGNTGSTTVSIHYDGAAPTVTPQVERPPDVDGWYNHPVKVAYAGQDGGSGVTECSPPVTYSGPDGNPAKLVGQCRDAVGHLSDPVSVELRYDHTKPARPAVKARRTAGGITVSWTSPGVVRTEVRRSPGGKGKKPAVVYSGNALRLVDRSAHSPSRYWYEVRVYDQAGNVASRTLAVQPSGGILLPVGGAVLHKAPLVRWVPVAKARFYNVQLWRGKKKLLTTWPSETRFRLNDTWTFGERKQHLQDGKYQVFVWPAFGTLATPRYGKLVGRVDFVVKRR